MSNKITGAGALVEASHISMTRGTTALVVRVPLSDISATEVEAIDEVAAFVMEENGDGKLEELLSPISAPVVAVLRAYRACSGGEGGPFIHHSARVIHSSHPVLEIESYDILLHDESYTTPEMVAAGQQLIADLIAAARDIPGSTINISPT